MGLAVRWRCRFVLTSRGLSSSSSELQLVLTLDTAITQILLSLSHSSRVVALAASESYLRHLGRRRGRRHVGSSKRAE